MYNNGNNQYNLITVIELQIFGEYFTNNNK